MLTLITFNTSTHTAWVENSSFTKKFENITTIKEGNRYYEMYQKQANNVAAPVVRVPIESTIIHYIHD